MKRIFLIVIFLLITALNLNAQDSESYVKFTPEQIETAKKTSNEKIKVDSFFSEGFEYKNKMFWFTTKDDKKYYFNSSKTFTDVVHTEDDYDSLMEYVIDESDF